MKSMDSTTIAPIFTITQDYIESTTFHSGNTLEDFEKEIAVSPRTSYNVQLKLYDILLPLLGGLIIGMNLMIVFSSGLILKKRQQPRSTYIFLGNVALADMLTGVATIFGQYYPKSARTEMVCCVQIGLIISATLASIFSIALIAIDRYLYILYGLQYQQYLASKRARLMVMGTWVMGGFLGFLPAMGWRNSTQYGKFCWLIILEPTGLVLLTVTAGLIPLILIIILYGIILKRALGKISQMKYSETDNNLRYFRGRGGTVNSGKVTQKHKENGISQDVSNNQSSPDISTISNNMVLENAPTKRSLWCCCRRRRTVKISSVYSPSRWKAIKIVAFTTGCFFITWFPYFLACALYAMCNQSDNPMYCNSLRIAIASPLAILGLTNSLLNPLIYAWWHNGFRESAKKIYNDLWRQRIRPTLRRSIKTEDEKSKCRKNTSSEQQSNLSEEFSKESAENSNQNLSRSNNEISTTSTNLDDTKISAESPQPTELVLQVTIHNDNKN